ncbi:MAG: flippase-like domain-containing protein [Chloroflexi bacterium]|nr:flippase-like domain-containing protein [Chloroflexota bacterium]
MNKRRLTAVVGLILTIVFLYLAVRNMEWAAVRDAFRQVNYLYLLPAAALVFTDYVLRSWRWHYILRPTRSIPVRVLWPILVIGFTMNNLLPARIGELARIYLLEKAEGISKSLGLATLIVERVFDGFTLLFLLAVVSLIFPLTGLAQEMEYIFLAGFGGVLVALLLMLYREAWTLRMADFVLRRLPQTVGDRLRGMLNAFILGLHTFRNRSALLAVIGISLVTWTCEAAGYWVLMLGFNLHLTPTALFGAAIFTLVMINLGILIPSAPGYVGTFQFFTVAALATFAVPRETALSFSILSHALQYLLITSLGLFFLWRANLSLTSLETEAQTSESATMNAE